MRRCGNRRQDVHYFGRGHGGESSRVGPLCLPDELNLEYGAAAEHARAKSRLQPRWGCPRLRRLPWRCPDEGRPIPMDRRSRREQDCRRGHVDRHRLRRDCPGGFAQQRSGARPHGDLPERQQGLPRPARSQPLDGECPWGGQRGREHSRSRRRPRRNGRRPWRPPSRGPDLAHGQRRGGRGPARDCGAAPLSFDLLRCRSSSRNAFGARSVATVITTGGRPRTCARRNASVRARSFFQHSRSHVPTARWTQNSGSYRRRSRSSSGRSRSPARPKSFRPYAAIRRLHRLSDRAHRRSSRNRAGLLETIEDTGPAPMPSHSPHPEAVSAQRSRRRHDASSRIRAYWERMPIPSAFSSNVSPDHRATARRFTSDTGRSRCALANSETIRRASGAATPRTGTGELTYAWRSNVRGGFAAAWRSRTKVRRVVSTSRVTVAGTWSRAKSLVVGPRAEKG